MNQIVSVPIIVQKRYSFQRMLEIHQAVKQVKGSVYLYSKQKQIHASQLTKLVSFLLTIEPGTTVTVEIHGNEAKVNWTFLTKLLENTASHTYSSKSQLTESPDTFTY